MILMTIVLHFTKNTSQE